MSAFFSAATVLMAAAICAVTHDDRFVAPAILRRMVTAGRLGRKTGLGFYEYGRTYA